MGSINHPRLYDRATMATIKAAFHDVRDAAEDQTTLCDTVSEEELKAAITRALLELAAEGTTSRSDLKMKVLRRLPLV